MSGPAADILLQLITSSDERFMFGIIVETRPLF